MTSRRSAREAADSGMPAGNTIRSACAPRSNTPRPGNRSRRAASFVTILSKRRLIQRQAAACNFQFREQVSRAGESRIGPKRHASGGNKVADLGCAPNDTGRRNTRSPAPTAARRCCCARSIPRACTSRVFGRRQPSAASCSNSPPACSSSPSAACRIHGRSAGVLSQEARTRSGPSM